MRGVSLCTDPEPYFHTVSRPLLSSRLLAVPHLDLASPRHNANTPRHYIPSPCHRTRPAPFARHSPSSTLRMLRVRWCLQQLNLALVPRGRHQRLTQLYARFDRLRDPVPRRGASPATRGYRATHFPACPYFSIGCDCGSGREEEVLLSRTRPDPEGTCE